MAHLKKCRWQSDNNEALKTAFEAFRNRRKTAKNVAKKITKNKVGFLSNPGLAKTDTTLS